MKNHQLLFFILLFTKTISAQKADNEIVGNYYLQGVREVGAGFELSANHTFSLFFSYGALDRNGLGTWAVVGDSVVFNSTNVVEKDFKLEKSEKRNSKGITIKITSPNTYLSEMVFAQINSGKNTALQKADHKGEIHFTENSVENINLIFQFCPEKISKFEIMDKSHNYLEFSMLQSILDFNFKNLKLKISQNKLTGKLPFLDEKEYNFVKEK